MASSAISRMRDDQYFRRNAAAAHPPCRVIARAPFRISIYAGASVRIFTVLFLADVAGSMGSVGDLV